MQLKLNRYTQCTKWNNNERGTLKSKELQAFRFASTKSQDQINEKGDAKVFVKNERVLRPPSIRALGSYQKCNEQ